MKTSVFYSRCFRFKYAVETAKEQILGVNFGKTAAMNDESLDVLWLSKTSQDVLLAPPSPLEENLQ